MSWADSKRNQYRIYLERVGVIDAMSKALVKLYENNEKPDDAIRYIRKVLCETCPDDDSFDNLKDQLDKANRRIYELEHDLERLKYKMKLSPEEIDEYIEDKFKSLTEDETCISFLRKYLTRELLDELRVLTTPPPIEATLIDCIKCGLENHSAVCGIFAADAESYDVFSALFDPIIREYHGKEERSDVNEIVKPLQPDIDFGEPDDLENLDKYGKYIISTRIRISRNLMGYPYFAKLKEKQFSEVENKVRAATEGLDGEHTGAYYTLSDLYTQLQTDMVGRGVLFKRGDPVLEAAGCYRYWPIGRGIFHNPAETFLVWVNDEDHLCVISRAKSGDVGDIYNRLIIGLQELSKTLQFARHPIYGNLTSCPTNLGTSLDASVRMRLPLLSQDDNRLKLLVDELNLEIDGSYGDHVPIEDRIFDVSHKIRMGMTEFELVKDFQDGIKALISAEEELEAGIGEKPECS